MKRSVAQIFSTLENTSHFVIERSINGIDFSPVGTVIATGNSTQGADYSFLDLVTVYLGISGLI